MSRIFLLRTTQVAVDIVVLSLAIWLAAFLRFEGEIPPQMLKRLLFLWPYIVALQYGLLALMGIPRFSWRYVGLREAMRILRAVLAGSVALALTRLIMVALLPTRGYTQYSHLPLGVVAIDFGLAFLGLCGVRVIRRLSSERAEAQRRLTPAMDLVPTLLVGAGRSGLMVAKEISARPELGILPIGFIDDSPQALGTMVHGVRVLGSVADIKHIAAVHQVRQAIITIASAPGAVVRSIANACQRAGLQVKVIPGLYQIVGGELNLTRMRDVAIEDLLRRDPVVLDNEAIGADLRERMVLVTGAGGSIGAEICRQVARFSPKQLLLIERAENALFEIHRELGEAFPSLDLVPCIADICDARRMTEIFATYSPDVVFHAAAHKHVPMMEWNAAEAVKNNVLGTRLLADMADRHRTRSFVMISTDKAVNPTSVMGATKRAAEIYVQALAKRSGTRFVTVRFGNVLGSNGSVVPIFKDQIARGGPVTVTHPEMKRYFMTIPEACQLVLQAGSMGRGGELFILDMGEPVKIVDLARDLIQLSGFRADEIEVVFTGIRPGEKLYEELSVAGEHAAKTRHPKIFIGKATAQRFEEVSTRIETLRSVVMAGEASENVKRALSAVAAEYRAAEGPTPEEEEDAGPGSGQRLAEA